MFFFFLTIISSSLKRNRYLKSHFDAVRPNPSNGRGCGMCTQIVNQIKQLLNDGKDDEEIKKDVEVLCEHYEVPYDSICDFYIEQFYKWIIAELRGGKASQAICVETSMCEPTTQSAPEKKSISASHNNSPYHFDHQKRSASKPIRTVNLKNQISQDDK